MHKAGTFDLASYIHVSRIGRVETEKQETFPDLKPTFSFRKLFGQMLFVGFIFPSRSAVHSTFPVSSLAPPIFILST